MSRSELSTSQELYCAFSTHKLLFLQVSVDQNPDISNVMCPLEENVSVVADRSRLCRGSFHTACMFTIRRLKKSSFYTRGFSYHIKGFCIRKSTELTRATISLGVWDWPLLVWRPVASMFSQWCNADASIASRFARLFMTKYCKTNSN